VNLRSLRRYATARSRRPGWAVGERCELCAAPLDSAHRHVVDLDRRSICCSCRPCALLFEQPGAGAGHYRTVPTRVCTVPEPFDRERWDALSIPVGLFFVFFNGALGRWVVTYPSPAGPTESELPLEAMDDLVASSRLLREVQPDVEALLVRSPRGGGEPEAMLVPIDACYDLVGIVRRDWKGFDGGDEVRAKMGAFFGALRKRSRPLPEEGGAA